ncbi:hemicentin-2-like [Macrobrachium nipponense]|uniref:hemicentin-2-like n=1 Tax=Macrobrachium nipponense TaxID=159736 RepID=UPI0030C85206
MLRLHHAQPSDAGTYLCQVSVSPPMSTSVTLLVTEAVASVRPGTDVYLKVGSRVVLVCEVFGCPYPASPAWYKGHKLQEGTEIEEGRVQATSAQPSVTASATLLPESHSSPAEDVGHHHSPTKSALFKYPYFPQVENSSLSTELSTSPSPPPTTGAPTPVGLPIATATLTRPKASSTHSGVYTCTNTCTDPVNLTLHVLIGDEETAAMQHPNDASRMPGSRDELLGRTHLLCVMLGAFFLVH